MSRDENEAIVRRFVDMWDTQKWRWNHKDDWSEFDEILSSDFVEHYGSEDVVGVQGFKTLGSQAPFGAFRRLVWWQFA